MDDMAQPSDGGGVILRRYGATAAADWQRLLTLFDIATGFALIVLSAPDADGAALCHRELAGLLGATGRAIRSHLPADPAALRALAATLPRQPPGSEIGAVWIECVVPLSDPDIDTWRTAWRRMLEGLNQQRNSFREAFPTAVVIVAARWVLPLFRECAPDLWSVRSLVVRIGPEPATEPRPARDSPNLRDQRPARAVADSPDPDFALAQAARLPKTNDLARARLLLHAARGLLDRDRPGEAETVLTEALALPGLLRDPVLIGVAKHELGRALLGQGRAAEAEAAFRRALSLAEEGGNTATSRGVTMDYLGRALLDQGRAPEAEAALRRALALKEQGGHVASSRGVTMGYLGRALLGQGRAAEADAVFRRALSLQEEGGATAASRSITMDNLGRALLDQGRAAEAEAAFRRALSLAEEGGNNAILRGTATYMLGRALSAQGRATEALTAARHAMTLMREGGAPQDWIDIVQQHLDQAIQATA
jgi:tetratricopeptide (TPR) repeat protein